MMEHRQLAAVMFTDIVGYTHIMQKNEARALMIRDRHREIMHASHQKYSGEIIQYFGDGTLSLFASSLNAVKCAMAMQKAFQDEPKVPLRIGIHSGDIIKRKDDIIGDCVNIASRIENLGRSGSILISRQLYKQIFNQNIQAISLGSFNLKNVINPIEILAVKVEGIPTPKINSTYEKAASSDTQSIVILPFVNMSNDDEQEYFCDGITDEIINSLSHVEDLKVIARTSAFMFKNKNEDVRKIGKKLNVSSVLEGSVRKAGNRLRITSQLVNTSDGSHRWSEKYDRELHDIFAIQDEISLSIVEALKINLLGGAREKIVGSNTQDLAAYDLYLRGQFEWYKRTGPSMRKSIALFQEALEQDSHYTLAKIGIALAYTAMSDWGIMKCTEGLPIARKVLDEVLQQHPNSPEANAAMAYHDVCNWDFKSYYTHYERALSLNNKLPFIHHLDTVAHNVWGNFERAESSSRKARRLDPLSMIFNFAHGHTRFISGKYEVAVDQFNYVLSLDPHFKPAALMCFYCLVKLDRGVEAMHMLKLVLGDENVDIVPILESRLQQQGLQGLLEWLVEGGIEFYGRPYNQDYHRAICHALLDQPEEMFALLEKLFQIRSFRLLGFRQNTIFEEYRSDPRFQELVRAIGFPS